MKINNVSFDDAEEPKDVTVTMTVDEAALIYAFVGHVSYQAVVDATNGNYKWADALFGVADGLGGGFFNRFWDDGAREVAPVLNPRVGKDT
jgi:hypothetical protein